MKEQNKSLAEDSARIESEKEKLEEIYQTAISDKESLRTEREKLNNQIAEIKEQNNGDIVFVATTVGDYKVMAEDMQELKRYLKQLGEVVVYYRNVTMPNGEKGVGAAIQKND